MPKNPIQSISKNMLQKTIRCFLHKRSVQHQPVFLHIPNEKLRQVYAVLCMRPALTLFLRSVGTDSA